MSEATRSDPSVGKQLPNKEFAVTDAYSTTTSKALTWNAPISTPATFPYRP
ncbi:MAG: hypothetical protein CM1200mP9_09520 [Gammaproteobacteria bacterium]|nr:MAG: hypothetical protein CM1200mP9_09520 [Gammaproteobacteria bacterium]